MSDGIVERARAASAELRELHSKIGESEATTALIAASVIVIEGLSEREPEWFAVASLLAEMEDVVRWVMEQRVRNLSG